jgi:Protein of unknown function (DUF1573)
MAALRFRFPVKPLPEQSLAAGGLLVLAWLVPVVAWAGPRLAVNEAVWDFGVATNRQDITHEFVIRNAGDAALEISRVVSSCEACLSAWVDKKSISPGETGRVHSRLDLRKLRGGVSRSISIFCNDVDQPSFLLGIAGVVAPNYAVTPPEIYLDLTAAPPLTVARILPLIKLQAPLAQVQIDNTNMTAQVTEDGPNEFVLTVRAAASTPRGRTPFNVTVLSSNSSDPPCLIQGNAHNPPDLEVIPGALEFRPQAAPQVRMLWIRQRGAAPMALLDVIAPSDQIQSTVEPDSTGYNYRINILASERWIHPGATNQLLLKMRDQLNHEHLIPVPVSVGPTDSNSQ